MGTSGMRNYHAASILHLKVGLNFEIHSKALTPQNFAQALTFLSYSRTHHGTD